MRPDASSMPSSLKCVPSAYVAVFAAFAICVRVLFPMKAPVQDVM